MLKVKLLLEQKCPYETQYYIIMYIHSANIKNNKFHKKTSLTPD